jgi:hypothetical protein
VSDDRLPGWSFSIDGEPKRGEHYVRVLEKWRGIKKK